MLNQIHKKIIKHEFNKFAGGIFTNPTFFLSNRDLLSKPPIHAQAVALLPDDP